VTDALACLDANVGRRKLFWTTRAQACGGYEVCGVECSLPGLEYEGDPDVGRTIKTDNWLQGLILNILNTRARTDAKCPSPPAVFGHWSESYRDDGLYIGATMWNAAERSYSRMNDSVAAIKAAITADMHKLVLMGIADSVVVTATYVGEGRVDVVIETITSSGRSRINLSGSFVTETWVWR
jgi:phage gp46-like protein